MDNSDSFLSFFFFFLLVCFFFPRSRLDFLKNLDEKQKKNVMPLERNAIVTMQDRLRLLLRFVDDVLAIIKRTSDPCRLSSKF